MANRVEKVLVVDDEDSIRRLVCNLLSKKYVVIEAKEGEQAVSMAVSKKPDLILMDILMPKMDGYTACHRLKSNPATKAIPIVMLTGLGFELNRELAKQMGVDGYLTKPFSAQQLLDIIGRLLPAS